MKTSTRRLFSLKLIAESDLAFILYTAFINHGIQPGIYMGVRTHNDIIPSGERSFMNACIKKSLMDGDTPVKIRAFGSKKDKEGN